MPREKHERPIEPADRAYTRGRLLTLSRRERQVLAEIATGKTNAEIAVTLFLCEQTVKDHANTIFQKLNVKNRVQAVLWWQEEERRCDEQRRQSRWDYC